MSKLKQASEPKNILKFPNPNGLPPTDILIFKTNDSQRLIAYHDKEGSVNSEEVIKFVGEFYGCNFKQLEWNSGNGHNDIWVEKC